MRNNDPLTFAIMLMTIVVAMWACTQIVNATDLTHRYKNPSFSGIGTSAHYLTIENQERTRSDAIREKRVSDEDKRQAALKNTNYAKFIKNLESRIYARFSKEMEEALFGEACGSTWSSGAITNPNSAVTNNEDTSFGDCSGEMTFNGTNIKFTKDTSADEVILEINGPDGNSKITLPLNDFQF
tara:strand:+ start:607 stop:1158 length:552 start_codon:yes stop_codon:yes gene_type:complete